MEAYEPSARAVEWVAASLLLAILGGFGITGLRRTALARVLAWCMLLGGVCAVDRACAGEGAGVRMLALCSFALLAMKTVVSVEAQAPLPFLRWIAFATLWVGMQPRVFLDRAPRPLPGAGTLAARGLVRALLGAGFILVARRVWAATGSAVPSVILLLAGIGLAVHFGLFSVVAGFWRWRGFACGAVCRAPLLSRSLSEFWGKRWNLAFSEMCSLGLYRPLSEAWGRDAAMLAVFLFSGALHEMAISLPVRAGFGLPTLYFALHGALMWVERRRPLPGAAGRAWTVFWVLAPTPILFHLPFIRAVVLPLLV